MRFKSPISFRLPSFFEPVDRILRNLDERVRELAAIRILSGVLVQNKQVSSTSPAVTHGLRRMPFGVIVIKSDATVTYKLDNFTKNTVDVTPSSGTRTVSLWIF